MNRVKWVFVLLVAFLLGICVGLLGAQRILQRRFEAIAAEGPKAVPALLTRQLAWRLDLTAAQQREIEPILRSAQGEFQTVRRQYEPQLLTVVTRAIGNIRATLTDEQRIRFKAMLEFQRSRWLATQAAAPSGAADQAPPL